MHRGTFRAKLECQECGSGGATRFAARGLGRCIGIGAYGGAEHVAARAAGTEPVAAATAAQSPEAAHATQAVGHTGPPDERACAAPAAAAAAAAAASRRRP